MQEEKRKEPVSWLKVMLIAIIAFFTAVFLYAYFSSHHYSHQALCTSLHEGSSVQDDVEWNVQGNETIEKITLTITRSISLEHYNPETADSEIALSMAGKYIQDIKNSDAVHTSFTSEENEESHDVIVTIEIDPSKLSSPDYEYLNANGFIRIGTIDFGNADTESLSTVLETDGYTCSYK